MRARGKVEVAVGAFGVVGSVVVRRGGGRSGELTEQANQPGHRQNQYVQMFRTYQNVKTSVCPGAPAKTEQ